MAIPPAVKEKIKKAAKQTLKAGIKGGLKVTGAAARLSLNLALDTIAPKELGEAGGALFSKNKATFSKYDLKQFELGLMLVHSSLTGADILDAELSKTDKSKLIVGIAIHNPEILLAVERLGITSVNKQRFAVIFTKERSSKESRYKANILKNISSWFTLSYQFVYLPNFPNISRILLEETPKQIVKIGTVTEFKEYPLTDKIADKISRDDRLAIANLLDSKEYLYPKTVKDILDKMIIYVKGILDNPGTLNSGNDSNLKQIIYNGRFGRSIETISVEFISRLMPEFIRLLKTKFRISRLAATTIPITIKVESTIDSIVLMFLNQGPPAPQGEGYSILINFRTKEFIIDYPDISARYRIKTLNKAIPNYDTWATDVLNSATSEQNRYWLMLEEKIIDVIMSDVNVNASFTQFTSLMR